MNIYQRWTNTYEKEIPLCSYCHKELHTSQAAVGAPGVTFNAIAKDQLRLYKKVLKNLVHIKGGGFYWAESIQFLLTLTYNKRKHKEGNLYAISDR